MKLSDDFEPDVFEMIFNNAFLTKISHFKKKVLTEGFKDHIALSYDDVLSELIILSRLTGDMISPLSGENKLKIQIQDNNYFENNYPFLSAPGAADEKKFERNLAELTISQIKDFALLHNIKTLSKIKKNDLIKYVVQTNLKKQLEVEQNNFYKQFFPGLKNEDRIKIKPEKVVTILSQLNLSEKVSKIGIEREINRILAHKLYLQFCIDILVLLRGYYQLGIPLNVCDKIKKIVMKVHYDDDDCNDYATLEKRFLDENKYKELPKRKRCPEKLDIVLWQLFEYLYKSIHGYNFIPEFTGDTIYAGKLIVDIIGKMFKGFYILYLYSLPECLESYDKNDKSHYANILKRIKNGRKLINDG